MIVKNVAMQAYGNALKHAQSLESQISKAAKGPEKTETSFSDALTNSIGKVNDMQKEKSLMIDEFASGKKQNVHELMITLQKAGLAMSMTGAVRNKVMTAYQELLKMPF